MDDYVKRIKLLLEPKIDEQEKEKEISKFKDDFSKAFKNMFGNDSSKKLGEVLGEQIGKGINSSLDNSWKLLKSTLSDSWKEFGNIVNYSLLSNSRTRELAFGFGFSGSQAYGYEKARSLMGFDSLEDLMYANDSQRSQFAELFSKYTNKYSELYDSGFFKQYREYQIEMEDFKQEVQMNFIKLFVDNKDTIIKGMQTIVDVSNTLLSILNWLVGFFGTSKTSSSSKISATNDIINSYSSNTSNKNTNVTIDNTFNNVSKEDQSWLSQAGTITYEQIIKALT